MIGSMCKLMISQIVECKSSQFLASSLVTLRYILAVVGSS